MVITRKSLPCEEQIGAQSTLHLNLGNKESYSCLPAQFLGIMAGKET